MKKAFVVSFEHLPACMLGCYGHQWIETPNFDRLASLSVLFDQHFANDLSLTENSFPWWTGQTLPYAYQSGHQQTHCFVTELKKQGIDTSLLLEADSDSGRNAAQRSQEPYFSRFDQVHTLTGTNAYQLSEIETPVAKLMQAAVERLPGWMEDSRDQLIWIRSEGVPALPLAPEFFATLYLDEVLDQDVSEEDLEETLPDIDTLSDEVTETELEEEDWQELVSAVAELFISPEEWSELDEQERQMARVVYAGYVTMLDQWFGRFLDRLLEYAESHSILLIVTAAGGGNTLLGPLRKSDMGGLLEESTHVPLMMFRSETEPSGSRRQFLTQPADLPVTLLSWWKVNPENQSYQGTDLLSLLEGDQEIQEPQIFAADDDTLAIRTADYYYLESKVSQTSDELEYRDDSQKRELYRKPVDRWDVADVHQQSPEVIAEFSSQIRNLKQKNHDHNLS
ncbi:sulfatase-like hydrolase/transferase [Gimesia algae]|uniref:Sulfatase n=1 Tax=Gimesia algae TaxID=2527971 RepID=A0A517VCK9_9PLAN|nr:sulfatase-like hydrolase/transferase [Gimesia algae]QDT90742.1 Sulfatase [Gimesia algae]